MNYFTLLEQIQKNEIDNLYLLEGKEEFLFQDILTRLKACLLDEGSLNYHYLTEEKNSLLDLEEKIGTLPFLAQKQLVVFLANDFLAGQRKGEEEALLKILEDIPPFTCLVVVAREKIDKRKKIYQTIFRLGKIVELTSLKPWELEKWIQKKAGELGKGLDRQSLHYLMQILGKDLHLISQELEKTALYIGDRERITQKDFEEILSKQGEQNIFAFLDALFSRKAEQSLGFLRDLLRLGEPPIKVLFMIHQNFRLVWQVKALVEKGYDKGGIMKKMQLKSVYPLEKALGRIGEFSWEELEKVLEEILIIDGQLKSSQTTPQFLLETLTLKICEK